MQYLELIFSRLAIGFVQLNAKNLGLTLDALSLLVFQGESDRLRAFLQGKSTFKSSGLKIRSVDITVEDTGEAEVSASEILIASADGMSKILYKVTPTIRTDSDKTSIIKVENID